MKTFIAILFILGSATLISSKFTAIDLYDLFETWKLVHNKEYANSIEEGIKFTTFADNYRKILEFNAEENGVTLGLTQFADLTPEEFGAAIQCLDGETAIQNNEVPTTILDTSNLPSSVNWTANGAVTSVKNQGQCGGCWAFAATASLEGYNFLLNGNLENYSEQQLIDCVTACEGCDGCDNLYNALNYTITYGIEYLVDYPFTGATGKCMYNKDYVGVKNTGYTNVQPKNVEQLEAAIAQQPTVVGIQANQLIFQLYKGGVISTLCGDKLDHAVTATGYGTVDGKSAFYIKNSWGATWGVDGYVYISTNGKANGGNGVCGILSAPVYPTQI